MGSDYSDLDFTGCPEGVGQELLKKFEEEHGAVVPQRPDFIRGMTLRFAEKPRPENPNYARPTIEWYGWRFANDHLSKQQVS